MLLGWRQSNRLESLDVRNVEVQHPRKLTRAQNILERVKREERTAAVHALTVEHSEKYKKGIQKATAISRAIVKTMMHALVNILAFTGGACRV